MSLKRTGRRLASAGASEPAFMIFLPLISRSAARLVLHRPVTCEFCWSGELRLRTNLARKLVDLGEEAPAECCGHS
jgi:hypothetical protein